MKNLPLFIFATVLAATAGLFAQEPGGFGLTPAQPDALLPEGQGALPLMPEAMPPLEREPQTGKPRKEKKSETAAAEDALHDRIKLRQARNKAQNDPALQELWDSQFKARTDFARRAILTEYYTRYWDRVARLDQTIKKDVIEAHKKESISDYAQTRIAPTVPPSGASAR